MRLVLVEWEDSYGCSPSWQPIDDCEPITMLCQSVGWLLHDGEDCKTLVPHITIETGDIHSQGCGDMTIPSAAILSITTIDTARKKAEADLAEAREKLRILRVDRDYWAYLYQMEVAPADEIKAIEHGVCELIAYGVISSGRGRELLGLKTANEMREVKIRHLPVLDAAREKTE